MKESIIGECIAELECISQKLMELANDPKNYNHPLSGILANTGRNNHVNASYLKEMCNQWGFEV